MEPPTSPPPSGIEAPPPTLTRRIRFRASHRYHQPRWDEAENARVFGSQGRRHDHDWTVDVTVRGLLDPATGWTVDLGALDDLLEALRLRLEGRDVAEALPAFAPGGRQPSTEELARWTWGHLGEALPDAVALIRVRVAESDELWAECAIGGDG